MEYPNSFNVLWCQYFWEFLLIFLFRPAKSHDLPSCAKKRHLQVCWVIGAVFWIYPKNGEVFFLGGPAVFGTISHLTGAREGFEDPIVAADLSLRIGHVFRDMSGIPFVTFAWWNLGGSCCIHCESHFKWTLTLGLGFEILRCVEMNFSHELRISKKQYV